MRNVAIALGLAVSSAAQAQHLNPMVDLLAKKQAVFGLYAPANPRGPRPGGGGPGGAGAPAAQPPAAPVPQKTLAELAKDALGYAHADYIFDGSMEGNFERGYPNFSEFVKGYMEAPVKDRLKHPLVVKMHEMNPDSMSVATTNIGRQLNLGVSTVVLVDVKTADEVKAAIAAMRFKSNGGTRADDAGTAPAFWGLSDKQYKEKADVWPLNPKGELLNWTIVESKEGIDNVRAIAQVPGIAVLFPGAGTLRRVPAYMKQDSTGRNVTDEAAWEAALQKVLDACNEFKIPCGFPANTPEVMEMRYKQGFRVFVIGWGDNGFKTVEAGLAVSGRKK
jgi:2-keto-3-deoxy-L-rhamnonate aldolase RhmA